MVEEAKDSVDQPATAAEAPAVLPEASEAVKDVVETAGVEPVQAEPATPSSPKAEKPAGIRGRKAKPEVTEPAAQTAMAPVSPPAPAAASVPVKRAAAIRKAPKAKVAKATPVRPAPALAPKVRSAKPPVVATPAAAVKPAVKRPFTASPSVKKNSVSSNTAAPRKELFAMATSTTEFTEKFTAAFKDAQEKAKAALEKSQAAFGDAGEFAKGNVEAMVESTKILATGLQDMTKGYVSESKAAFEGMTADVKELTTVKSPTEFFEKQSALLRKNFDAAVAASSKNSEAFLKLANEAFQPISTRVSLAVEKIKKAA